MEARLNLQVLPSIHSILGTQVHTSEGREAFARAFYFYDGRWNGEHLHLDFGSGTASILLQYQQDFIDSGKFGYRTNQPTNRARCDRYRARTHVVCMHACICCLPGIGDETGGVELKCSGVCLECDTSLPETAIRGIDEVGVSRWSNPLSKVVVIDRISVGIHVVVKFLSRSHHTTPPGVVEGLWRMNFLNYGT